MANPAPYELFPVPPEPPYTWDDPRICWDEPCFFYDGGFDLVCLFPTATTRKRRGGGGGTKTTPAKSYPTPEVLSLVFKTCIDYVNDEELDDECEIKKFKFKKELDIDLEIKELTLKGKSYKLVSEVFSPRIIKKHMSSSNTDITTKRPTVISSQPELKLKPAVSSSLVLNKARRIKFKSSIIKKKTTTED